LSEDQGSKTGRKGDCTKLKGYRFTRGQGWDFEGDESPLLGEGEVREVVKTAWLLWMWGWRGVAWDCRMTEKGSDLQATHRAEKIRDKKLWGK